MVCLMCLIPLFLIPVVNALPLLFHIIMARVYGLMGWEYRKPARVPPACPFKPPGAADNDNKVEADAGPAHSDSPHQVGLGDKKSD